MTGRAGGGYEPVLMKETGPDTDSLELPYSERVIAGFWRRLAALAVDLAILAVLCHLGGVFVLDLLVRPGAGSRLIVFGIGLAYFGVLNSRAGGGRTAGKRKPENLTAF